MSGEPNASNAERRLLRIRGRGSAGRGSASRRSAGLGGGSRHVMVMHDVVVHDMVMHDMVMHDMMMGRHRSRLLRLGRLARWRGRRARRGRWRRRFLGEGVSGEARGQDRGGEKTLDHGSFLLLERIPAALSI